MMRLPSMTFTVPASTEVVLVRVHALVQPSSRRLLRDYDRPFYGRVPGGEGTFRSSHGSWGYFWVRVHVHPQGDGSQVHLAVFMPRWRVVATWAVTVILVVMALLLILLGGAEGRGFALLPTLLLGAGLKGFTSDLRELRMALPQIASDLLGEG